MPVEKKDDTLNTDPLKDKGTLDQTGLDAEGKKIIPADDEGKKAPPGKLIFGKYKTMEEAEKGLKELESTHGRSQAKVKALEEEREELQKHVEVDSLGRVIGPRKAAEPGPADAEFREKLADLYENDPTEAMRIMSEAAMEEALGMTEEIRMQRTETRKLYGKEKNYDEIRLKADKLLAGMNPRAKAKAGTDLLAFKMARADAIDGNMDEVRKQIRAEIEAEITGVDNQHREEGLAGGGGRGGEVSLTASEKDIAGKLGISEEKYLQRKKEIKGGA